MSMRAHDLQNPYIRKHYRHGHAAGPDPVNVILLASIFVLSGFLLYSVVTTMRYVPALEETRIVTQRGLTPAKAHPIGGLTPFVGNVEHAQRGLTPAEAHPIVGLTPSTGTQSKPWYEKPPYVRESLLSERIAGYRPMKADAQSKHIQAGILK